MGAESEAKGDKMRKGCLQIGLASPRLADTAGPGGFLPRAGHPRSPLSGPHRAPSHFPAGSLRKFPPTPFYASPLKTREPQSCGQLLLGNVVPALFPHPPPAPDPLEPRNRRSAPGVGRGVTHRLSSHAGRGPGLSGVFPCVKKRLQRFHL